MTSFDCTDIKATLSGLIDDEIDAETRRLAERHLAQCAACRTLISQAEALDDLVATDAAALAPQRLPDGFVDGVLNRTVYARMYEQAGWNWMTWAGWVAAAACLLLASAIWVLDRRPIIAPVSDPLAIGPRAPTLVDAHPAALAMDSSGLRSWTFDDALEPGAIFASNLAMTPAAQRAIDTQLEQSLPSPASPSAAAARAALSMDDSDTLHAAAVLLDMLGDSDLKDFGDIERAREIAIYDELPRRLADVRARLHPSEQPSVIAAESILLRVVNGPIDMSDARLMRDSINSLRLAARLGSIGAGRDAVTSM